jgi:hypothetical protein|tara:strand:+ start:114 stop:266 length:153 start_codon:yes stop_codon:yes gene_type:complete
MPAAAWHVSDFKNPKNQKSLNSLVSLLGEITERMLEQHTRIVKIRQCREK